MNKENASNPVLESVLGAPQRLPVPRVSLTALTPLAILAQLALAWLVISPGAWAQEASSGSLSSDTPALAPAVENRATPLSEASAPTSTAESSPNAQRPPKNAPKSVHKSVAKNTPKISPTSPKTPPLNAKSSTTSSTTSSAATKGGVKTTAKSTTNPAPEPVNGSALVSPAQSLPPRETPTADTPVLSPSPKSTLSALSTLVAGSAPAASAPPSAYAPAPFGAQLAHNTANDSLGSESANSAGDAAIVVMEQAFKRTDVHTLTQQLPLLAKHPLEPWGAYWTLRARLNEASVQEVKDFLSKFAGTYVEDRMRNDWLLLLASRRDWTTFADQYPLFRMRDDRELQCYGLMVQWTEATAAGKAELEPVMKALWLKQKEADDGCTQVVDRLFDAKRVSPLEIWQKAWWAAFNAKQRLAHDLVSIVHSDDLRSLKALWTQPARYLKDQWAAPSKAPQELVVMALARLAGTDPAQAAQLLQTRWGPYLTSQERHWVWGAAGVQSALRFESDAVQYFEHVSVETDLNDEMLTWWTRLALKAQPSPNWRRVEQAIAAMSEDTRKDPAWIYWGAKASLNLHANNPKSKAQALSQLETLASVRGFYEQLALEDLGRKITPPPKPSQPSAQEIHWVYAHPGLQRALYAINLGLQSPGAKEWNYNTTLVNDQGASGRLSDSELLASAMLACKREVFDRCIYSAEKTLTLWDTDYLFPTPFKELVVPASLSNAIDPAFVYGLMRQESRFVKNVKSVVGASGLMQVMPKTAIWTAKKIGLSPFSPTMLKDKEVNVAIGTGYMGLVLQSLDGSLALAAAAYNAGPSRARKWREVPGSEGAIWVENIPFSETRDYVKKVLSNTTLYAGVMTAQPQSLKAHLNNIGPSTRLGLTPLEADLP